MSMTDASTARSATTALLTASLSLAWLMLPGPALARQQNGPSTGSVPPTGASGPANGSLSYQAPAASSAARAAPPLSAGQERHLTHAQLMRLRQMHRAPNGVAAPAEQNRELDQIGNKLLKSTPKAPPGSSQSTGGGTIP